MRKTHSHENVQRLIAGEEEQVLKALMSIDRVFETLCTEISDEKGWEQDEIIAKRQCEEEAKGAEIFLERLLVKCIGFWSVGLIQNVNDLRAAIKIMLPMELGDRYYQMLDERGVSVDQQ